MANIPIGDNIIYMKKKGSTDPQKYCKTILLGSERIDVGIDTGQKEIVTDLRSGMNYERNAIDNKTIYNLVTQHNPCFIVLDLETGKGGGWYPGAIKVCPIRDPEHPEDPLVVIQLKSAKSDTSSTVIEIPNKEEVKINNVEYGETRTDIWYNIT